MRSFLLAILVVLVTFTLSMASDDKNKKVNSYDKIEYEKMNDDLKERIYELKFDMRQQIEYQNRIINEQAEIITEMRLKIKGMESELFQATQSLRNLELEVWDMQKTSNK